MSVRTDLAIEIFSHFKSQVSGVSCVENKYPQDISVNEVKVQDAKGSSKIGKPIGNYVTIESPNIKTRDLDIIKYTSSIFSKELKKVIDKNIKGKFSTLVIGLGNENMTADALGNIVLDNLIVTRHIYTEIKNNFDHKLSNLSCLSPKVLGVTGIETFDIVSSIVEKIKPDLVIVIDSLASQKTERIATTFQISDSGIIPGSGLNNSRQEISKKTLNVPVISIGVPLVVYAKTITFDVMENLLEKAGQGPLSEDRISEILSECVKDTVGDLVVTPKDIDVIVKDSAYILSVGINLAIHRNLDIEEVISYIH